MMDFIIENISAVVYFCCGAIFTAVLTYFFNSLNNKKDLKENLNFKVSNKINEKIYICLKNSTSFSILSYITQLKCYKMQADCQKKLNKVLSNYKTNINEYDLKSNLLKQKEYILEKLNNYHLSVVDIILYIESNCIVLNKFLNFRQELIVLSERLLKDEENLTNFMYFECENWENTLEEKELQKLENKLRDINKSYEEIKFIISAYLVDLQTGIQNEVYSKFYKKWFRKYKILYRNPKEGKVIKPIKPDNCDINLWN